MKKAELREGLQRLKAYLGGRGFESMLLEEGAEMELDSLLLPLEINDELSIDISCNFVHVPEFGYMLQYYGHLEVDGLFAENPESFTEYNVLQMLNAMNQMIPVGQFLFMQEQADGEEQNVIGIRYTMLTALDNEVEMEKCVSVIQFLMHIYELLCSGLMLLLEGETVQSALHIIADAINL